jgi:hypothetical protein
LRLEPDKPNLSANTTEGYLPARCFCGFGGRTICPGRRATGCSTALEGGAAFF